MAPGRKGRIIKRTIVITVAAVLSLGMEVSGWLVTRDGARVIAPRCRTSTLHAIVPLVFLACAGVAWSIGPARVPSQLMVAFAVLWIPRDLLPRRRGHRMALAAVVRHAPVVGAHRRDHRARVPARMVRRPRWTGGSRASRSSRRSCTSSPPCCCSRRPMPTTCDCVAERLPDRRCAGTLHRDRLRLPRHRRGARARDRGPAARRGGCAAACRRARSRSSCRSRSSRGR